MIMIGRMLSNRKLLIGAILASLIFRCFLIAEVAMHPDRAMQGDAGHYDFLARQLLENHRFWGPSMFLGSSDPAATFKGLVFEAPGAAPGEGPMPEGFRTPGYPVFLTAVRAVSGHQILVLLVIQTLLVMLIGWMLFRICTLYASSSVGWLAVALFAWNCEFLELPNLMLTETLFGALLVLATWCVLLFAERGVMRHLVFAGIAVGLAALCRPAATYFAAALVPVILWSGRRQWRRAVAGSMILLSVCAITMAPWLARNKAVFGRARLAAVEGLNLYLYNTAFLDAKDHGTSWTVERRRLSLDLQSAIDAQHLNPLEASDVAKDRAIERISRDPVGYGKVHAKGMVMMLVANSFRGVYTLATGHGYESGSPIDALSRTGSVPAAVKAFMGALSPVTAILLVILLLRVVLMLAALRGFWHLLRQSPALAIACVVTVGYYLVITGPLGIDPRFRAPLIPALTILAAVGIGRTFAVAFGLIRRAPATD